MRFSQKGIGSICDRESRGWNHRLMDHEESDEFLEQLKEKAEKQRKSFSTTHRLLNLSAAILTYTQEM